MSPTKNGRSHIDVMQSEWALLVMTVQLTELIHTCNVATMYSQTFIWQCQSYVITVWIYLGVIDGMAQNYRSGYFILRTISMRPIRLYRLLIDRYYGYLRGNYRWYGHRQTIPFTSYIAQVWPEVNRCAHTSMAVRVHDCVESVSNSDDSALGELISNGLLDYLISSGYRA